MPFVSVKILEGHSIERKRKMVKEITECVARIAEIPESYVQVIFQEFSKENWAADKRLLCDED